MVKKILIVSFVLMVSVVLTELIALFGLKSSVGRYAEYWRTRPATGEYTLVVLGDSAAQSIGASKPELGYVGLLAARINQKTGKSVRIVNLSVSGARIKDVTSSQIPQITNYDPDLLIVEIGGNDVVNRSPEQFATDYTQMAQKLPEGTIVANIPFFGGRIRKNNQAVVANDHVAQVSKEYGLRLVDLQTETRTRDSIFNYSSDLFHPSNRGYSVWADAFWKVIEPKL